MKPETTLKEILKPPFMLKGRCIDVGLADGITRSIMVCLEDHGHFLPGMRYEKNPMDDEFNHFTVQALNEKWERDFSEPLRWEIKGDEFNVDPYLVCPNCNEEPELFWDGEDVNSLSKFRYCPSSGKRLLPPKGV